MRGDYKTGTYPTTEITNGTPLEQERFQQWSKAHSCSSPSLTLYIADCRVGFGLDVVCSCGAKSEITDYDSW